MVHLAKMSVHQSRTNPKWRGDAREEDGIKRQNKSIWRCLTEWTDDNDWCDKATTSDLKLII